MPDTIRMGTILIKEDTPLPGDLMVESEPYVPGWRLVKNLDAFGLDKRIQEAGWTFACSAGEMNVTVFGLDQQVTVRRAVGQILANLHSEKFNSLEITQAASLASKRFPGVTYLTVSAHSRHVQEGMILAPATDFPMGGQHLIAILSEL